MREEWLNVSDENENQAESEKETEREYNEEADEAERLLDSSWAAWYVFYFQLI